MRRLVTLLLASSICLTTPLVALAQEDGATAEERYDALTTQAATAYEAGEYAKAVELFEQAYELRAVSNILYNIGRIHEEAGNIDAAIEYYDKFVVAPNVQQAARKDALDRLKTLREVKAVRDGTAAADATPAPTEAPPAEVSTSTAEAAEPKTVVVVREEEPKPGRVLGWALLGVGGASLVGSGIFGLLAQSQFSQFEEATTLEGRRDAASAGRTNAVVADSLLVTGFVTAVVGGVVLLMSSGDTDANPETAAWTVTPVIGRGTAGMGLGLSF